MGRLRHAEPQHLFHVLKSEWAELVGLGRGRGAPTPALFFYRCARREGQPFDRLRAVGVGGVETVAGVRQTFETLIRLAWSQRHIGGALASKVVGALSSFAITLRHRSAGRRRGDG